MSDRPYRILLIDDSREDRQIYRRALLQGSERKVEVLEAETGEEGLLLCRGALLDCVVLDHRLPDMDAVGFLASLRHGAYELPMPVIVLTGQGSESVAVRALKAGAHDYLVKGASEAELNRVVWAAIERIARPMDRKYRVLIVEDNREDREFYKRRLCQGPEQFEFEETELGEEAVALCQRFNPDCVLLDYGLPDMNGLEVLAQLGTACGKDKMAVLMLTGQGSETIAVQALKAGAEDYLVKGPALDGFGPAVRSAVEKVTLRRRIEEERREVERSRNELRVTLSSIGDAVISTDVEGRVTFLNPIAEELTGWKSKEARTRPLEEIFVILNEHTREPAENPALRALREGSIVGLANHTALICKDGAERPIDDSAAPIRDETGNVFGAVLVFRDVTQRRHTEQSLLLQASVLESMVEGVSVADEQGIIFYTNPAEDRMFGYQCGELVGQHVQVLNAYPPDENERRVRDAIEQLKTEGSFTGEWHNRRKDGSTFTSFARITMLETLGKRCFVCVQEDVTDRKRLEAELQQRLNDLALADKRKDEFLAMLAHELRNPLAPIRNSLHVLKLKHGDWQTVDQVREIIERQTGHLGRLVDDLLDVSRITQGKVKLKMERLNVARVVEQAVADHRSTFGTAQIALRVDVPEKPLWVDGDATRLNQILDNMFSNALKFTNPGGEVSVAIAPEADQARIMVRDTGIGIPPELLPHVFDVFSQADKSLDRSRGGLGLGLAIVKKLVELHGGAMNARSEGLGKGAEISFFLPLKPELPPITPLRGSMHRPGDHRRVLVIEDNVDSARSLEMLLKMSGYEVRVAYTGPEGRDAAHEWAPELVICDIGLPGMDGFAVARRLREEPATMGVRLIALTGYGQEQDVSKARDAGFDELIVKPADAVLLLEKLGAVAIT